MEEAMEGSKHSNSSIHMATVMVTAVITGKAEVEDMEVEVVVIKDIRADATKHDSKTAEAL